MFARLVQPIHWRSITVTCARFIAACLTAASLSPFLHAAQSDPAAAYPARPVRLIVPFLPGAGNDTTARAIAQKLGEKWNQQMVVDNRPGAAGTIGVDMSAKANPDGYTICIISASIPAESAVNPKLPYDLTKDLQGITQATSLFYVLYVHPSLPVKTVADLVAHAKANPNKLNFGTSGTLQPLSGALLSHMTGIRMVRVPYKGTSGVVAAMLSGEVQVGFGSLIGTRTQMQAGRLRGIAITALKRSPAVDLPTVAESGLPGYEVDQWYGIVTSSKVPKSIVTKLNAAMVEALRQPDVEQRLAADGSTLVASAPEQFNAHMTNEVQKWTKVVREANLKIQN
ncbi:MAG: tripartite tricarboxylate transporter substrate binding protein [Burkholderiales bacterium]